MNATEWRVRFIRKEDIGAVWGWLGPWLQRAFDKAPSDFSPEVLRQYAEAERVRFWLVTDSDDAPTAVFATGEQPGRVLEFFAFAGDRMLDWLTPALDAFVRMASGAGITALRMSGRRGWEKPLVRQGFRVVHRGDRVTMERDIQDAGW